ncbi:MAG: LacI family DNA-binding transcriptional regulator [Pseudomonadota bacterium]
MKGSNPTSRDIAEAAGVSQATVSRALRDSPLVRPETRELIQNVAQELGYSVNRHAASLRRQSSNTIALLLFDETDGTQSDALINPFFLAMLSHISKAAAQYGYDVLVSLQELAADWHIEYQASYKADGLILLGYGDYESYQSKLAALAETDTRFVIWGPIFDEQPGRSFGCDNETGGEIATRHLIDLGCRRIAFIGDTTHQNPELADRHRGYRNALKNAGLQCSEALIFSANNDEALGFDAMNSLLDSDATFDGVFAATDLLAIGAIRAMRARGVSVPDDVRIVGFDDIELAAYVTPPLTTVRQDIAIAGQELVRRLVLLIEGQHIDSTLMQPQLIVRESCGG